MIGSMTATETEIPIAHTDPINAQILAVSEDRIQGFVRDPFGEIARQSGLDVEVVIERIRAMLRGGTIRRVRQTLMATNLAEGALVAWQFPNEKLDAAFDFMFQQDPFSGHVVIRSTDAATPGSNYRLWTTVKVPQGYSIEKHCEFLATLTGAEHFRVMPAQAHLRARRRPRAPQGDGAGQQVGRAGRGEGHGESRALAISNGAC